VSSFPAQIRKAGDSSLPPIKRLHGLRESTLHFSPYGFRATWHHLVVSAAIPQCLDDDPDSLSRAATELAHARELWHTAARSFAARRRTQKSHGRRTPMTSEWWFSSNGRLAYCPDPEVHPCEPLPVVVVHLIAAYRAGADEDADCLVCGRARPAAGPCADCGVDAAGPGTRFPREVEVQRAQRWWLIWQRAMSPTEVQV
jgi:hypothetical protein